MSPLGPVGVANFGSTPWVSRMCLAAGLRRNLEKKVKVRSKILFTFYDFRT